MHGPVFKIAFLLVVSFSCAAMLARRRSRLQLRRDFVADLVVGACAGAFALAIVGAQVASESVWIASVNLAAAAIAVAIATFVFDFVRRKITLSLNVASETMQRELSRLRDEPLHYRRKHPPAISKVCAYQVMLLRLVTLADVSRFFVYDFQERRNELGRMLVLDSWEIYQVWFRERSWRYLCFAVIGTLTLILTAFYDRNLTTLAQAALILAMFLMIRDPRIAVASVERDPRRDAASLALMQLFHHWLALWMTWFVLYVILYFDHEFNNTWLGLLRDVLDLSTSFCLFVCYLVLTRITVVIQGEDLQAIPFISLRRIYAYAVALVVCFAGVGAALIATINSERAAAIQTIARSIISIVSGTSVCLFVGRFESRFIQPPLVAVVFLYVYGVLQAAVPPSAQDSYHLVLGAAFLLKCLLFVFVTWLLESGVLLNYLFESRLSEWPQ